MFPDCPAEMIAVRSRGAAESGGAGGETRDHKYHPLRITPFRSNSTQGLKDRLTTDRHPC